jgi:hypothetical protein
MEYQYIQLRWSCLQVLVAYPYGCRVLGRNDRGHQRGRSGLRGLERPDHTRYQGQCVRACTCAARPHAVPAILSALSAARPLHACYHAAPARVWPVGFRGRENARHGLELEPFCRERHAERDFLCRKPQISGFWWQSSYGTGRWRQDHRIPDHIW